MAISKNTDLIPAICQVYYLPLSDVVSIAPYSIADRFDLKITIPVNTFLIRLYFTPGSAELSEKQKQADAGDIFEQNLKLIFPGDQGSNTLAFDAISSRPLLILVVYSSGMMKVMGTIGNGARLLRQLQISPKSTNIQLEFSCTASDPMGYVSTSAHITDTENQTGGGID